MIVVIGLKRKVILMFTIVALEVCRLRSLTGNGFYFATLFHALAFHVYKRRIFMTTLIFIFLAFIHMGEHISFMKTSSRLCENQDFR